MPSGPQDAPKKPDLTERLERLTAEQRTRSERLKDGLEGLSATATSQDRTIKVTVGPGGAVQGITLTQQALRHGPDRLGQLILSTIHTASATVSQEMNELIEEATGNSVDFSALMRGETPKLPVSDPDEYMRSRGVNW